MNSIKNEYITSSQFTIILISAMLGVGSLYVPNAVIKFAKQDGWVSCILGTIYPVYILIIASYMKKKCPDKNILELSKEKLGNFFGNFLNVIFISYFLFVITSELAGISTVFKIYIVNFLKSYQIVLTVLIPIAYSSYKGIRCVAKLCEMVFYIALILILTPSVTLVYGSFYNLMPVFDISLMDILRASKEMSFFYAGIETIFLIYPYLNKNNKIFKPGIISILFISSIYVWYTFLAIYYLGIETSQKYLWPVITLSDSVKIPIINGFRYLYLCIFAMVIFRCLNVYYFAISYGLNQLIKKVSIQKFSILIYPVIVFLSSMYGNPTSRRSYTDKLIAPYVIFILIYVSLIAILIRLKKGGNIEKI